MHAQHYAVLMANYNLWMNERLFALLDELEDAERRKERGLFFGSMHRTLDHITWADRLFHNRLLGTSYPVTPPSEPLFDSWQELCDTRGRLDAALVDWAMDLAPESLEETFEFRSVTYGVTKRTPKYVAAIQMFNHQTHHRGQVHAALTAMGRDVGSTDIPFMPYTLEHLAQDV